MLEMITTTHVEETNELIFSDSVREGAFICMGRFKSRSDIIRAYNQECGIGAKLVRQTADAQEVLDYWLSNPEKWIQQHKYIYEEHGCDFDKCLRKTLSYFVKVVQLVEDGKVIEEETFRYGH